MQYYLAEKRHPKKSFYGHVKKTSGQRSIIFFSPNINNNGYSRQFYNTKNPTFVKYCLL